MHMTDDEIVVRYRQAKDQQEQVKILAQLNNCSTETVAAILVKRGEIEMARVWTAEEDAELIRMKKNGASGKEMAERFDAPEHSIKSRLQVLKNDGLIERMLKAEERRQSREKRAAGVLDKLREDHYNTCESIEEIRDYRKVIDGINFLPESVKSSVTDALDEVNTYLTVIADYTEMIIKGGAPE